jgi:hypothetical protein
VVLAFKNQTRLIKVTKMKAKLNKFDLHQTKTRKVLQSKGNSQENEKKWKKIFDKGLTLKIHKDSNN